MSETTRRRLANVALCAVAVLLVFTAADDVQFGDGMELVAVSAHFGVAHPPGYPLFTALGWVAQRLFAHTNPYQATVWMMLFFTLGTCALLGSAARHFARELCPEKEDRAAAATILLCGVHGAFWSAATIVEVYALQGLLCAAVAVTGVRWCSSPSVWKILISFLLVGLAVANHLTALALLGVPVALALMLPRNRRVVGLAGGAALFSAVVTVLYLSLLWRASGDRPGIFWGDTTSGSALLHHALGGEYRQFRFLQPSAGVHFTLATWWDWARELFLQFGGRRATHWSEALAAISFAGLTTAFMITGGLRAPRSQWMMTAALAAAVVAQVAFVLLYPIPDAVDYRTAILATGSPLLILGAIRTTMSYHAEFGGRGGIAARGVSLGVILLVLFLGVRNYPECNRRGDRIARSYIERLAEGLPERSAIITHTDADIYSIWYLQWADRRRNDVVAYGGNFIRQRWFRRTLPWRDVRHENIRFVPELSFEFAPYLRALEESAVVPLLEQDRLFTTNGDPVIIEALAQRYDIEVHAALLSKEEFEYLLATPERGFVPPLLLEILWEEAP